MQCNFVVDAASSSKDETLCQVVFVFLRNFKTVVSPCREMKPGGPPATKQPRVEMTGSKGKAPGAPGAEQLRAMIKEVVAVVLKEQGVELPKSKESEDGAPRGPPAALGSGEIF